MRPRRGLCQTHLLQHTARRLILLLQQVSLLNSLQHTLLGSVLDIAPHQKLIQDEVGLLKVKDDVQLTHTAEVFVQELYISVDQL